MSAGTAVVPILFYRSMLLAADVAPIDALCAALHERGIAAVPVFVASLKDKESVSFVETSLPMLSPSLIVTATAFASGAEPGEATIFDRLGVPVMQAIVATTRREAWANNQRGLAPADLAMHVVLPELDGRIHAGALAFKSEGVGNDLLGFRGFLNQPEPDRVEQIAERIAKFIHLQQTPRAERKLAILIPDYPAAAGRTGYAVGLDVPASVLAMLGDLKQEGYAVEGIPQRSFDLLSALERGGAVLSFEDYAAFAEGIPEAAMAAVNAAWGKLGTSEIPFAPPSVLPDISPSRGEIGSSIVSASPTTWTIVENRAVSAISPLEGEMSGRTEGGAAGPTRKDFRFRAASSATSPWRSPRIGAGLPAAALTITIPRYRRTTHSSPLACGCRRHLAATPSSMSVRMARWSGCRARRWRFPAIASRKSSPDRCR